jgi:hypothetical protein
MTWKTYLHFKIHDDWAKYALATDEYNKKPADVSCSDHVLGQTVFIQDFQEGARVRIIFIEMEIEVSGYNQFMPLS